MKHKLPELPYAMDALEPHISGETLEFHYGGGDPRDELAAAIDRRFGSADTFRTEFAAAAKGLFGSGWVWLAQDPGNGELSIESTKDAGNPLMDGHTALLTCDVWEHAYYIDYRNKRAPYIEAFRKLVNWEFAASRLGAKADA